MPVPWPLVLAIAFLVLALLRFGTAVGDARFLASSRMASKATYGFAFTVALFAVPLAAAPVEPFLIPLGVAGLAGLFLAPPTPRYSFVLAAVAVVAGLAGAAGHLLIGFPAGLLLGVPVGLAAGHLPVPGRPSLRFLAGLACGVGLAWLLPSPLYLAPVALVLLAVPAGPPYAIVRDEAPWDHRMLYYLGMLAALLAATVALFVGVGEPLRNAQVALGLILGAILLVPVIKAAFGLAKRFVGVEDDAEPD